VARRFGRFLLRNFQLLLLGLFRAEVAGQLRRQAIVQFHAAAVQRNRLSTHNQYIEASCRQKMKALLASIKFGLQAVWEVPAEVRR